MISIKDDTPEGARPFAKVSSIELEKMRHAALVSPNRDIRLVIDIARERYHRMMMTERPRKVRLIGLP